MKIVTIIGARPQFIKASILSLEFSKDQSIEEVIIHTGQHFDHNMSQIFFEEMLIPPPRYNLGVQNLSHGAMTGRQLEKVEEILLKEKPDFVLVYGDTNSTLAGSLAAAKLHIPIAHVEAGLRSFNKKMPEEVNRVLTDHLSELLFVPTSVAVKNLKKEGINVNKIKIVGDVMYDAALHFGKIAEEKSKILEKLNIENNQYILATVHRPENTDHPEKLKNIISALSDSPLRVVMPIHPRTKKKINDYNIQHNNQLEFIEPVGYLDIVMLEKNACKIATDSGGIQKEAYFHGVPCITMRDETEWIELIEMGANQIVGSSREKIRQALYNNIDKFETNSVYGTGDTSLKIINILEKYHNKN